MSAPVLSTSEQKDAISGKKKKKKSVKNVLDIPTNLKLESQFVEIHETEKLKKILERLFPTARLPVLQNSKSKAGLNKDTNNESDLMEIKNRRNQLSLGVNALSRSIKKELISAVLLASDIQPKFLVHHLNILCSHNKIPFLHLPGLRSLTKKNLGFPCIAVGFKKNFSDFLEAVDEINTISNNKKSSIGDETKESPVESSSEESEEEEVCNEIAVKSDETPFTYLLRSSTKERIFVPENCNKDESKEKSNFILVGNDDNEIKYYNNNQTQLGISGNLNRKKKSKLEKIKSKGIHLNDEDDGDDDEDLEVPKKKTKKDWVIDKVGTRPSYYPASLRRVPSNPDRNRRK